MGAQTKSPDRYALVECPSELSEDMWGELPRFQDYQHKQQMKKEKEKDKEKRDNVRKTLDN